MQIRCAYFIDFLLKVSNLIFVLLYIELGLLVLSSQDVNRSMGLLKLVLLRRPTCVLWC